VCWLLPEEGGATLNCFLDNSHIALLAVVIIRQLGDRNFASGFLSNTQDSTSWNLKVNAPASIDEVFSET
jgi:hypothetical protein